MALPNCDSRQIIAMRGVTSGISGTGDRAANLAVRIGRAVGERG